ncbi:MAG: vanadium-dependent haloperoxidase, partial [Bdellovibrionales bacterium]|nr:vanadium-dependent haloperoxidase [Bdellovibrionales bacterium]
LFASQQVLESRSADGSNQANGFVDITSSRFPQLYAPVNSADPNSSRAPGGADFDLNHWQPLRVATGALVDDNGIPAIDSDDPSTYADQTFLTPHWGNLTPFSLTSANQFRPQSPPQAGSSRPYTDGKGVTMTNDEAWNAQFDEVLQISADLTDRQKVIAEFWADGPRTESPPGHWNQLAHGVSERDGHSVDEDIKMFFALNASLFDVAIATWEAKRNYDFIRPASAIRHKYFDQTINAWAGPNLGTQPILGQEWRPYQNVTFVTPPFPEFVSGHSTFSSSAAQVLTLFTGSNVFYDGVTQTSQDVNFDGKLDMLGEYIAYAGSATFENTPAEDVVLQWPTFQDAAYEAGISRLYGGIHIQDGNLFGRAMGEAIGQQAFALAQSYWDGSIAR